MAESPLDAYGRTLPNDKQLSWNRFVDYYRFAYKDKSYENKGKRNPVRNLTAEQLIRMWRLVDSWGINIDSEQAIFDQRQATGIMLTYIGCKNMILNIFPKAKIEVFIIYKDDEFSFTRTQDGVEYTLKCTKPFEPRTDENIVGAACLIRTNDGSGTEVFEVEANDEFENVRKSSKRQDTWRTWPTEMMKKSVLKRASKLVRTDNRFDSAMRYDNAVYGNDFDHPNNPEQTTEEEMIKILEETEILDDEGSN